VNNDKSGESKQAIGYLEQALEIAQKMYGNSPNPLLSKCLETLSIAYRKAGETKKAEELESIQNL
jgi:tetratricopeptide (TPR) repeat protein